MTIRAYVKTTLLIAQQVLSLVASLLVSGFTISGWLAAAIYA